MANDDIAQHSLADIKRMKAQGLTIATPVDAPEIELGEAFWRNAKIVQTAAPRKTPPKPVRRFVGGAVDPSGKTGGERH